MIKVKTPEGIREVPEGTTFFELTSGKEAGGNRILAVLDHGVLRELRKPVKDGSDISYITLKDKVGDDIYKRSLNHLFLKAVHDVLPEAHAKMRFSNGNGYFYTLSDRKSGAELVPGPAVIPQILERMGAMVKAETPFIKQSYSVSEARTFFREQDMEDKDELFRFRRKSGINLYDLDGYKEYQYGYMVHHAGYLPYYGLESYRNGLALVLPDREEPSKKVTFRPYPKIFEVQSVSEKWAERIGINNVADLNNTIASQNFAQAMLVAEALQESRISDLAQEIIGRGGVKFVMIAGPSSSGKTTFSRRLSIQLRAHGMTPHPVSLDDFYLDRRYCPKDENGNYDFECLEALDVPLIEKTLSALIEGKKVEMPHFNFRSGSPEYKGDTLQLSEGDILILEGIHGLNPKLCGSLPAESVFRIYISALTQLNVDEHMHISTVDGRLLRRIVRDHRTRGSSAEETIRMWPSVRNGEKRYIFPNQENADAMFNSALIYELSILKIYAEPLLFQIREDSPEYIEAKRLLKFLDYFLPAPSETVPNNSVLREFIGGSCFDV